MSENKSYNEKLVKSMIFKAIQRTKSSQHSIVNQNIDSSAFFMLDHQCRILVEASFSLITSPGTWFFRMS